MSQSKFTRRAALTGTAAGAAAIVAGTARTAPIPAAGERAEFDGLWRETDSEFLAPDVAAVEARVSALESNNASSRLDDRGAELPGAEIARFKSRAAAVAATIGATVDAIETLGYAAEGDGGGGVYVRAAAEPAHDGKFQDVGGTWWEIADAEVPVKALGAVADDATSDHAAFQSATEFAKTTFVEAGDYYLGDRVLVRDGDLAIIGQPGAMLRSDMPNQSFLDINGSDGTTRLENITVAFLTFLGQPAVGGGSSNNNHPLRFSGVSNGRALFNNFVDCGLGIRFGRSVKATPGGRGTHDSLSIGAYFHNPKNMLHEFMDDDSTGNKAIAWAARSEDGRSSGTAASHAVRFNGWYNIAALGSTLYFDANDTGTGMSFQGGGGHIGLGVITYGADQGTQYQNNPEKHVIAHSTINVNSKQFGVRGEDVNAIIDHGICYWDADAVSATHLGLHMVGACEYWMTQRLIDGSVAGTGADHIRIEGDHVYIDHMLRNAAGGLNGVHLTSTSSYCMGRIHASGIAAGDASWRDVRIDGVRHQLSIRGQNIVIAGTGHILDIYQYQDAGVGSASIFASDSIITIHAKGPITISGSNNTVVVDCDSDLTVSGTGNTVRGSATGTVTNSSSVTNDLTGLNVLRASVSWAVGSIAAGAVATKTIAVAGANRTVHRVSAHFSGVRDGLMLDGWVTAGNDVTVQFYNPTASAINAGTNTLTVHLERA